MIGIGSNSGRKAYGIKHYNVNTESDILKIPVNTNKIGSTCFVIDSSKYYMLNSKFQWIEIFPFGTSSSSGDSSGPDAPQDDVIYEGGVI